MHRLFRAKGLIQDLKYLTRECFELAIEMLVLEMIVEHVNNLLVHLLEILHFGLVEFFKDAFEVKI